MIRQVGSNEQWLVRSRLSAESSPAGRLIPALGLRAGITGRLFPEAAYGDVFALLFPPTLVSFPQSESFPKLALTVLGNVIQVVLHCVVGGRRQEGVYKRVADFDIGPLRSYLRIEC